MLALRLKQGGLPPEAAKARQDGAQPRSLNILAAHDWRFRHQYFAGG